MPKDVGNSPAMDLKSSKMTKPTVKKEQPLGHVTLSITLTSVGRSQKILKGALQNDQ